MVAVHTKPLQYKLSITSGVLLGSVLLPNEERVYKTTRKSSRGNNFERGLSPHNHEIKYHVLIAFSLFLHQTNTLTRGTRKNLQMT